MAGWRDCPMELFLLKPATVAEGSLPQVPSTLATKPAETIVFAALSSTAEEIGVLLELSDWVACQQPTSSDHLIRLH